jgi:hypothetical protein
VACQPDQFEIPSCLALEAATRLNPIQVPIDVKLEQGRWMICRSTNQGGPSSREAKARQVKVIDEHVNHPYRVLCIYVIVETLG